MQGDGWASGLLVQMVHLILQLLLIVIVDTIAAHIIALAVAVTLQWHDLIHTKSACHY